MKLKSIEVQNFRSIVKTTKLQLDLGLTVILGPNNEGKSNILRAIVLAMECLRAIRSPLTSFRPKDASTTTDGSSFRLHRDVFDWEIDFPLTLQEKNPDGECTFLLEFALDTEEQKLFKAEIGSNINQSLPLEITLSNRGGKVKVKKQGKGANGYESKSREIARFVSGRFEFQYIPAIRPSELSLEVVGTLMDRELAALASNPEYQEALKTIEDLQKPVFENLAVSVQRYLKKLLPSVKTVKINSNTNSVSTHRSRFRTPKFIVDDGTATELESKGDGIKSLVAISLMRATKAGGESGDLVT